MADEPTQRELDEGLRPAAERKAESYALCVVGTCTNCGRTLTYLRGYMLTHRDGGFYCGN